MIPPLVVFPKMHFSERGWILAFLWLPIFRTSHLSWKFHWNYSSPSEDMKMTHDISIFSISNTNQSQQIKGLFLDMKNIPNNYTYNTISKLLIEKSQSISASADYYLIRVICCGGKYCRLCEGFIISLISFQKKKIYVKMFPCLKF